MLTDRFGNLDLAKNIIAPDAFRPVPKYIDREAWEKGCNPETVKVWLKQADEFKTYKWPSFLMDRYLILQKTGETGNDWYEFVYQRGVLGTLLIAECMEGKGNYINQIINGTFACCEETSWMVPFGMKAGNFDFPNESNYIVDLTTAQTAELLTWVYYLMKERLDEISKEVCNRIKREIYKRIIVPYIEHDDYWWMGLIPGHRTNNWNPWCNMNLIFCATLIDYDEDIRVKVLDKAIRSLDYYIKEYPADGGCDEGPMYWEAAGGWLSVCLIMLKKVTNGVIDIFDEQKIKDIGAYAYKSHIHDNYVVDYADGDAINAAGGSLYHFGKSIGDEKLIKFGAGTGRNTPYLRNWFYTYDYLMSVLFENEKNAVGAEAPYIAQSWLYYNQILSARETEGSHKGFFLSAKGGTNIESHNHNDIGNFIIYIDGKPLIIDLGTEEYVLKTFSPQRFELWYLQSQYHNCPTVGGVMQHDGKEFRAKNVSCEMSDNKAEITMDIAEAYEKEAEISSWVRKCSLTRGSSACVEVSDNFKLYSAKNVVYNLMTLPEPVLKDGKIYFDADGSKVVLEFDNENLEAIIEPIPITESRHLRNWGSMVYRIQLTEKKPLTSGSRSIKFTSGGNGKC